MKKILLSLALILLANAAHAADRTFLNVSYDPTRELYEAYNAQFTKSWKTKTGETITIQQSHGGSGKQARSVIDGLSADVVTLGLAYDIDTIAEKTKAIPIDWQKLYPHNSSPYTSTIVFLVRKGNPKQVKDWNDLTKEGLQIITPNPKTSGGARWNYLAAWGYALKANKGNEEDAKEYLKAVFKNVPVLDTGARGATTTFVQRSIGDVLIAWENEAYLAVEKLGKNKFEIVYPSQSILAEPPVALVKGNTDKKGTTDVATAYLEQLYSPEAQELIAANYYRPSDAKIAAKYKDRFKTIKLETIADFGGWQTVQKKHFDDGGTFDEIFKR